MNWARFAKRFALYLPLTVAVTIVLRVFLQHGGDFSQWRETLTASNLLLTLFITGFITWSIVKHHQMYENQ